ncbi:MAG: cytochrome c [Alphaproteobacteria bacterium]|nr:MAG: cytochrome c [Alphaproteobacteria bacterium]
MRSSAITLALGAAVLVLGSFCCGAVLAQDKDKVIAERQDFMKQQIRQWIIVRNYVQGNAEQPAAVAAADALVKLVPMIEKHFPPGTAGPTPDGKWATKPEVWSEHDKFVAAEKKVAEQVAALDAAVKSGDKAKVEVAFKDLDACNACHNTFRAKLQ